MNPLTLAQIAEWSGGTLEAGSADRCATAVGIDSRQLGPGSLFVALRGERVDGHGFLAAAAERGAIGALVEREVTAGGVPAGFGVIRVDSTVRGLQALAGAYRRTLGVRVAAVTGSSGKTGTKEMVAAVLSQQFATAKTTGNLNNHLGVPLTLLGLDGAHQWAVVEMGMNHPGELRPLAELAAPEIGLVTNVGWAHVEAFADREAIAREKLEVVRALGGGGAAVLPQEDPHLREPGAAAGVRVVRAGRGAGAEVRIVEERAEASGMAGVLEVGGRRVEFRLPVWGAHWVENAALAAAAGWVAGVAPEAIARGLGSAEFPGGRGALHARAGGWLLDDTYNANPDSVAAALRTLGLLPGTGRKVALLGAMAELGGRAAELHRAAGRVAAECGVGFLAAVGPHAEDYIAGARGAGMPEDGLRVCASREELTGAYRAAARSGDRVLVKGSRREGMEAVVAALLGEGAH